MNQPPRARDLGLLACHVCGQISRNVRAESMLCPRCGSSLHPRKPNSLARSWALLLTAMLLYLPANLLPIMRTASPGDIDDNTILSGVVELWNNGSWDLAILVFTASIVVPALKFVALSLLLLSCQRGWGGWVRGRVRLYRVLEFIGYWSMLDVFVVALLTAVVRFGSLSTVEPPPGVIFFSLVVVLTMLASKSFDPRAIWDWKDGSQ